MSKNLNEVSDALKEIIDSYKPAPIDEDYILFGAGKYDGKKYRRKKPVYGLQIEVDKIRLHSTGIDDEIKELIARRHGWGRYTEGDEVKFGKGFMSDKYNEITVLQKILEAVSDAPRDYDINDLDTGEAERLINDFLLSCRS